MGSGTGRLGLGAGLLGAKEVILFDIDFDCLKISIDIAKKFHIYHKISVVNGDIRNFNLYKNVDTVIQNPPFGVHKKGYDVLFLLKAIELANVVYSIHKLECREYIIKLIKKKNLVYTELFKEIIFIPPMFSFHKKKKHKVNIVALRITKGR